MLPQTKLDTLLARHATLEAELMGQVEAATYVKLTRELAELSPFYGVPHNDFALARYFEARMIEKHLELLERRGLVEENGSGSYRLA